MDNKIITRSPIDGSIYVERDFATQEQIDLTFNKATQAQASWAFTSIAERQALCHKMVDAFVANRDEISTQLTWMMGRPIRYATGEIKGVEERARYMIDIADTALETKKFDDKPGFKRFITREPLGVCFVIAPWNYPYLTAVNAVIPAIMAGNSVVLKHSAQTPLCAEQFAKAFNAAALPSGVFQYLHLSHRDTETVIKKQPVNYLSFTGSVIGGKTVERAAAGRFIHLSLELGGKDPAYVCDDANIEKAAETCIDGAFFNSGQSCCGIERIYVHQNIYHEFVERAVALVKRYRLGRPDDDQTTLGPVISATSADFIRKQIDDAVKAGATTHIDPAHFPLNKMDSPYLAPQLLTDVDHNMRLMTEETFGPVVGIMKVKDDQQAISLMNDSEFGLTASVFSSDINRAINIGNKIDTGTFFVNRCDFLDPALAWVGIKNSGRGCSLSSFGYHTLTRPKSFHVKTEL